MFKFLFPDKPETNAIVEDSRLGVLKWQSKRSEWAGNINEIKFTIDYEKNKLTPSKGILEYTYKVLLEPGFLDGCLKTEVESFIEKVPEIRNIPEQMNELNSLYVDSAHIGINSKGYYTFVCLGPEIPERFWRMELKCLESNGLGFDS